jgi:hypothetical protein
MIPALTFPDCTALFIRALATYGYSALASSPGGREIHPPIPPTRFDEDQSEEVDVLDDPEYLRLCRDYDRQLFLSARSSFAARADKNSVSICGLSIAWPKRMARLKTWGGQQDLAGVLSDRLDAMFPWAGKKAKKKRRPKGEESPSPDAPADDLSDATESSAWTWETVPATLHESAVEGVSGIIPGHAQINAIDMGFSPLGHKIRLHPWLEILVTIGMESAPLAVIPSEKFSDGQFAVYSAGLWYPFFRRVRIDPYYYAWDVQDDRGLLPHQFTKLIDPTFQPKPFDDLQIPLHLLKNPDLLWNEIERLNRIANRREVASA